MKKKQHYSILQQTDSGNRVGVGWSFRGITLQCFIYLSPFSNLIFTFTFFTVIGGTAVNRFDHPHMAAIGYGNSSQLRYLCGGTVISEYFVISAAHCRKHHD